MPRWQLVPWQVDVATLRRHRSWRRSPLYRFQPCTRPILTLPPPAAASPPRPRAARRLLAPTPAAAPHPRRAPQCRPPRRPGAAARRPRADRSRAWHSSSTLRHHQPRHHSRHLRRRILRRRSRFLRTAPLLPSGRPSPTIPSTDHRYPCTPEVHTSIVSVVELE